MSRSTSSSHRSQSRPSATPPTAEWTRKMNSLYGTSPRKKRGTGRTSDETTTPPVVSQQQGQELNSNNNSLPSSSANNNNNNNNINNLRSPANNTADQGLCDMNTPPLTHGGAPSGGQRAYVISWKSLLDAANAPPTTRAPNNNSNSSNNVVEDSPNSSSSTTTPPVNTHPMMPAAPAHTSILRPTSPAYSAGASTSLIYRNGNSGLHTQMAHQPPYHRQTVVTIIEPEHTPRSAMQIRRRDRRAYGDGARSTIRGVGILPPTTSNRMINAPSPFSRRSYGQRNTVRINL